MIIKYVNVCFNSTVPNPGIPKCVCYSIIKTTEAAPETIHFNSKCSYSSVRWPGGIYRLGVDLRGNVRTPGPHIITKGMGRRGGQEARGRENVQGVCQVFTLCEE